MKRKSNNQALTRIQTSPIHGLGLFARSPIALEEYIGTYEGRLTQDDGMHVLWIWNEDTEQWEGIEGENELRYLNHSPEPNAEWWGTDLYAIRNIEAGEEITFDYGWDES